MKPKKFILTNLFDEVKMTAGSIPEFPVDFLEEASPKLGKAYILSGNDILKTYIMQHSSVYVPCDDVACEGNTPKEALEGLLVKLKDRAFRLLIKAGKKNKFTPKAKNVSALKRKIEKYFEDKHPYAATRDIRYHEQDNKLIAVNRGYCVAPYYDDMPPQAFSDYQGSFYSFVTIGFAVLDHKEVVIGKIK